MNPIRRLTKTSEKRHTRWTKLMPAGWTLMSIVGIVLLAAWNTGNNLFYLILALLISAVLATWLLGRSNLRRLAVGQSYPPAVYQDESFSVRTVVANRKRLLPSFMIETDIHPELTAEQLPAAFCTAPRGSDHVRSTTIAPHRGLIKAERITVRSTFPAGLFEHGITRPLTGEMIVYPAIHRIHATLLELLASEGEAPTSRRGDSRDFYGIREYRPGDDSRLICWKISAKHGRLMLREFERHEHRGVMILLDGYVNEREADDEMELFEKAVSFCASLAWHYVHEGYDVGLRTPTEHLPPGCGAQHLHRVMEILALVEPAVFSEAGRGADYTFLRKGKNLYVPVLVTLDSARPSMIAPVGTNTRVIDVRDLEF